MSQESQRQEMTKKRVLYEVPGMDAVTIRRDVEYRAAGGALLTMDIYDPPDRQGGKPIPAVIKLLDRYWSSCGSI